MSLGDYIKWCSKCQDSILTTEQMRKGLPCYRCQKEAEEHAKLFKERFEKLGEKDE